jgi:2-aminoadipate transaminase
MLYSFSNRGLRSGTSPINELIQYDLEHDDVISLAAGLVDYESLPVQSIAANIAELMSNPRLAQAALQYGTTRGLLQLREQILEHFRKAEGNKSLFDADDVIVTNGSQQLLFLLADILLNPGDIVLVEAPTYFVFMDTLKIFGVEIHSVAMDGQGVCPEALKAKLQELRQRGVLERVKLFYTVDYFQNPSGISLIESRKSEIFALIQTFSQTSHPILILEDAAYRDLGFNGVSAASFKGMDIENNWVLYTSTLTKTFSPGLKCGYGILPKPVLEQVMRHKGCHDFGTANLVQHLIAQMMLHGEYPNHLESLQKSYAAKALIMNQCLEPLRHKGISWQIPSGGLYFWLKFPSSLPTGPQGSLFKACLKEKVLYVPGEYCFHNTDLSEVVGSEWMRLSYGTVPTNEISEACHRLIRAVDSI